jgi:hypothetical protein
MQIVRHLINLIGVLMDKTSAAATGAAGAITTGLVALLGVANTKWNLGITPQEQFSIAVGAVTAGHWLLQKWFARNAPDAVKKDVTPA